jgi:two-component system, cell cycle response regulator DivK
MKMSKTVLIVEDNEKNLKLFSVLIVSLGCGVLTAADGEVGVSMAREKMPDLILMDIQMPRMDGVEALKILRADEKTRNIPVLALTSYAMKGDRERLIESGFSDYISKPINKDGFVEAVRKALGGDP